ncbi:NAD(P)/FAD-dependent oxidoreductase [Pararhizobium mangrovi]|uniref:FAD-binding oxidoreductase n=1 Tax=Pararhizobium mangrovi TaxID=2590452 RepID=A0A506U8Q6_9HYPH|nr:FAD-binding oxidoreductase [Pararhizobium mangrovi]TPW28949.1 FAD-binding oxidoreductase [Pararhizobium mangrovi]
MPKTEFSVLWRASSQERAAYPALGDDLVVDIAIVGGGFTGSAAALEAARSGASVCLLEAETIGHGGSGRNVGLVNAGLWLPPDAVIHEMGEEAGTRLVAALGEGPQTVFSSIEREGIECEATRRGTLHLAHSKAGLEDLEERFRQGNRFGVPLELLDRDETARRTGTQAFEGALFDPRAGTIQPLAYCRGLARAAAAHGAHVFEHSPVASAAREGDTWLIEANGRRVRAGYLLMATNAYHSGLAASFRPTFVRLNYCQFATRPIPAELRAAILPGGEGCWDTAMVMSSLRLDDAGRLIVGGVGSFEGAGRAVHERWARRKVAHLFPALKDIAFEHGWSGAIAMTGDHIPKIVAFDRNAYASFGYSGRGIAPGTVFGTAAAKALLNGTPEALPMAPVETYRERYTAARSGYYAFGAAFVHAVSARRD